MMIFLGGVLFSPLGEGPFPGVLALGGAAGGLEEFRVCLLACLLANHGFATMSLAYFSFEDLPKFLLELALEYFEEALHYFQNLPQVRKGGVGIMGMSEGADLALSIASFLQGVSAVACLNGNMLSQLHYRGSTMPGLGLCSDRIIIRESGVLNVCGCWDNPQAPKNQECVVPVDRASACFLLVVARDDQLWESEEYAQEIEKHLLSHGWSRPEILALPGAGHLLEPLYFPFCPTSLLKIAGIPVEWGVEQEAHAAAQQKCWYRIREFFLENLGKGTQRQSKL
ncbi:hypothetical protein AAFF_G00346250 [Aldrovandia affinis]|uniref:BAAT/Acyl-CoA thioester hydrolase C-terminal domain-containing protein n=1 Tax=Aldrovandia affinis TaxID=143900 RepID=A0AAD7SJF5_9TELE|nr:hypothetical protein AAFF_G00346250 [Aldrovandia affinis]